MTTKTDTRNPDAAGIPAEILERIPLMRAEYMPMLKRLQEHAHAPRWNYHCGDRLTREDVEEISQFNDQLVHQRGSRGKEPPAFILRRIEKLKKRVPLFRERLKKINIETGFFKIPPTTREDMAARLEQLVPEDVDLERLIVNPTSGTTGHPIQAVNHPRAIGCYNPMIMFSLNRHGVFPEFHKDMVSAFLICAQAETAVYCTVKPVLNGAGFAKINLFPGSWKNPESPSIYIHEMKPFFLTGDPFSFSQLTELGIDYKPAALLSTSLVMTAELREKFVKAFNCPVVDFYSLNETGPIGYSCPKEPGSFHLLPVDVHIEVTDSEGNCLPEGELGEITVTGGRNPYLPLLRYRTGDRAKLDFSPCSCGDPMPRLVDFAGRPLTIYRDADGGPVNPVDINRIILRYPAILRHRFSQVRDAPLAYKLELTLLYGASLAEEPLLRSQVLQLFKNRVKLEIKYTS